MHFCRPTARSQVRFGRTKRGFDWSGAQQGRVVSLIAESAIKAFDLRGVIGKRTTGAGLKRSYTALPPLQLGHRLVRNESLGDVV